MNSLDSLFREQYGVVRASDLVKAGVRRRELDAMLRDGQLRRLRHGWYAHPSYADADVELAVAAGGVLSCVSALRLRNIWTPSESLVHARASADKRRQRLSGKNVHFCSSLGRLAPTPRAVDDLGQAVLAATRCLVIEELVAVFDSMLHHEVVTRAELEEVIAHCPAAVRAALDRCDGRSESGTESLVRFRLQSRRIRVRAQVVIAGIGRVDLLVGRRLVIEVDSRAHHTGEERYASDRTRDRLLAAAGYIVIRLTYEQVMFGWDEVLPDILRIIGRGEHLAAPGARGLPRGKTGRKNPHAAAT